jgi:hypothetical protein
MIAAMIAAKVGDSIADAAVKTVKAAKEAKKMGAARC